MEYVLDLLLFHSGGMNSTINCHFCWSLAVFVNFLLVAVAVGTIGAERDSQEGEQIGMFSFC